MEEREALDRLRRLEAEVAELRERLRRLEGDGPPPETETEEREGDFGPAVKRADPSRHQHAVSRALQMLGVVPAAPQQTASRAGHAAAIAQVRRMSGKPDVEPEAPAPEALPKWTTAEKPDEPPDVDLEGAIAVDLVHESRDARVSAVYLLLPQVILVAGVMAALPGPRGVLASLPIIALLALPVWGRGTRVLRAHARFFTIMILARCLAPDLLLWPAEPRWWNLRFAAMAAACVPGLVLVASGTLGWRIVAPVMAGVAGAAVGLESGRVGLGLVTGGALLLLCLLLRRGRV